jgi:glycerol-3-phosphate dehydrogenase
MNKIAVGLGKRQQALQQLAREQFDLLVIGGGITGVGIAQDAAARGLKTALVERRDFAIGTSSRSSKLIHGGLRYLAQGDFRVTYESCAERALLQELAPHLVKPTSFLIPVYRWGYHIQLAIGLWLYDVISRLKNSTPHQRLDVATAASYAPGLQTAGLHCGYLYHDCQTSDARLVLEVAKSAVQQGAVVANYLEVINLLHQGSQPNAPVCGALVQDVHSQAEFAIQAKVVVNATGVWLDNIRQFDEPQTVRKVRPAKGVHVVIDSQRIPTKCAMLFESGANDRRSVFFIPWYEGIVIGTTDTEYQGDIANPQADERDIAYILHAVNQVFPQAHLTTADVRSSYAGLRPLIDEGSANGKSTKDVSREHKIFVSPQGLVSIAGGKLTTYRRMAKSLLDEITPLLRQKGISLRPSCTDKLYLSGLSAERSLATLENAVLTTAAALNVPAPIARHLVADYGSQAIAILDLIRQTPSLATPLLPSLPFIQAEVVYSAMVEQATTIDDIVSRRTRINFFDPTGGEKIGDTIKALLGKANF